MITRRTTLRTLAGTLAAPAVIRAARAQTPLKFAHVYETSEAYHTEALWAAEQIRERSGGKFTIEVFPASSLGKETDINQGLTLGTVDMIYTGMNFAGRSFEPLTIASGPYMFRDVEHWRAYTGSDLWAEMRQGYEQATGHHVASVLYYGERHVTSKKPINHPDDMKGLKIRVPDAPLYVLFPKAVGANPTPIAFAEVYLALQQGTVDAQENPLPTILAKKFYEPTPIINLTAHITESLITICSGMLWGRLEKAEQAMFDEVLQAMAQRSNAAIAQQEEQLKTGFKELGATVNPVDRQPFIEVVAPHLVGDAVPWSKEQYERLQRIA